MTMLITKFHRLIQNKTIWFLFSVVVVMSFVVWDMQLPDADDLASQQSVGEIHGKPISPETFQKHRFNTYLAVVQQIGQAVPYQEIQEELEPMIWRRMVALETANDLDLQATDNEVRAGLSQQQAFAENGQFSKARYEAYVRNVVGRSLGIPLTTAGFEDHIREEVTLRKLENMVQQTVLLPPYELKRRYRIYNDIYTADAVVIRPDAISSDISTSQEEAQAYFEEDPSRFTIPAKRSVKYFRFPITDFVTPEEISEEQIQAHYDRNILDYVALATNEVAAVESNLTDSATHEVATTETNAIDDATVDTDVAETSVTTVTNSLEEVAAEIRDALAQESARFKASAAAMDLITELAPDRSGNAVSLSDAAVQFNLETLTAGPYAEDDVASEFGVLGREVVEQTWLLTTEPNEYFSNPIEDREAESVYVIALDQELDARVPSFEEVSSLALIRANRQKIDDTVIERAAEFAESIRTIGDSTNTLATLAKELGYEAYTFSSVNLATGLQNNAYADVLVETLVTLSNDEVSEPVQVQDGYMVVQVLKTEPADDAEFESYRRQVAGRFRGQITSTVFIDWQEQLLRDANFSARDFDSQTDPSDEDEDDLDATDPV